MNGRHGAAAALNLEVVINSAVTRFGDRRAVFDADRSVTFRELGDRVGRLGTALTELGFGKGTRIASLQYNTIEAIETDLMTARFGFVRTLLNARGSVDDHAYCLNHCGAQVLFFGAEFADHVARLREQVKGVQLLVCVGDAPGWAEHYDTLVERTAPAPVPWPVNETDLHSIYYTSGTTGRPKGVLLSQRNWLVLVRNHLTDPFSRAAPDDVVLHAAPLSHASGAMVFSHLARGASQRVIPRFDVDATYDSIARDGITTTFLAPTMIHMMLDAPGATQRRTDSLHTVMYGGAPMAVERVRETLSRWGSVLAQGYGQWEAPQVVCWLNQAEHTVAIENPKLAGRLASCGQPLTFVRIAVMDDEGRLLPPGEDGEIVTAGDHLMVEYLDNPEATAEIRHGEWQRSGDIGRIDADGYVYLTDRKKDVIITGGSNVYPREIEEVLYQHPDVAELVAIGVPHDRWGETVHVVAVPREGRSLGEESFLAWCRERLPSDKRPRSMTLAETLPKSAYGKILRREVREGFWRGRDRRI